MEQVIFKMGIIVKMCSYELGSVIESDPTETRYRTEVSTREAGSVHEVGGLLVLSRAELGCSRKIRAIKDSRTLKGSSKKLRERAESRAEETSIALKSDTVKDRGRIELRLYENCLTNKSGVELFRGTASESSNVEKMSAIEICAPLESCAWEKALSPKLSPDEVGVYSEERTSEIGSVVKSNAGKHRRAAPF